MVPEVDNEFVCVLVDDNVAVSDGLRDLVEESDTDNVVLCVAVGVIVDESVWVPVGVEV